MKRGGELIGLDMLLLEAKVVLFSKLIIIVGSGHITAFIL